MNYDWSLEEGRNVTEQSGVEQHSAFPSFVGFSFIL